MPGYPRVIAHRCGGAAAPENSLAGLRLAARLGARGTEFDVMLSRDGVPVLFHDETLERTTGGSGRVADHDHAELARLTLRATVSPAPIFSGERIPTLDAAWRACREIGLWANVELKPGAGREAETGRVVGDFLRRDWRDGAGIVSSFAEEALRAFAAAAPAIPRALLVRDIPSDWRERMARCGAVALHCAAGAGILPERLAEVVAAGVPLACYTVNDRAAGDRLLAAGAAAIFTDRPEVW